MIGFNPRRIIVLNSWAVSWKLEDQPVTFEGLSEDIRAISNEKYSSPFCTGVAGSKCCSLTSTYRISNRAPQHLADGRHSLRELGFPLDNRGVSILPNLECFKGSLFEEKSEENGAQRMKRANAQVKSQGEGGKGRGNR